MDTREKFREAINGSRILAIAFSGKKIEQPRFSRRTSLLSPGSFFSSSFASRIYAK
jgi:hypothetical protein